jgi:hypothetical protein
MSILKTKHRQASNRNTNDGN